jgi:hypothetical protein
LDDADRDLLNQARPYLIQSYRNAIAVERHRPLAGVRGNSKRDLP